MLTKLTGITKETKGSWIWMTENELDSSICFLIGFRIGSSLAHPGSSLAHPGSSLAHPGSSLALAWL